MNAGLAQSTSLGPLSPAISPVLQIASGKTHDALNDNKDCFNSYTTNINIIQSPPTDTIRRRRVSTAPSLASIVENPSSYPLPVKVLDLVDGLSKPHLQHSRSPTPDEVEGRYIHREDRHSMPVALNSEASIPQASSQAYRGHVKRRSGFVTMITKVKRVLSRKSFQSTCQDSEELQLWTEFNLDEVNDYLPGRMDEKYKNYMRSPHLAQINAIPVWNPSPIREVNVRRRIRIDVGDVGTFTRRGGFRVAFNILLNEKTNKSCGYDVPKNFFQFSPPLTYEQARSCSIKDDGIVIDLDDCGAIASEAIECSDALSYGFKHRPHKSSREMFTTRCEISPDSKKDNRRGYVFLPNGAKIYRFSHRATDGLTGYLNARSPDWAEYLNRLWHREKAPPIILTAVWAARSFACATYTVNPPNTSAIAQVWTASNGEKIHWAQASEGFETARAPLDDGYDENAKLKSRVEDQCFAIEGYVLKSLKAISKLRESVATIETIR